MKHVGVSIRVVPHSASSGVGWVAVPHAGGSSAQVASSNGVRFGVTSPCSCFQETSGVGAVRRAATQTSGQTVLAHQAMRWLGRGPWHASDVGTLQRAAAQSKCEKTAQMVIVRAGIIASGPQPTESHSDSAPWLFRCGDFGGAAAPRQRV